MTIRTQEDLPRCRAVPGVFRPRGRSWMLTGVPWLVLAMALAMALSGCSEENGDVEELSGYFGPGSGGTPLGVPPLPEYILNKANSTTRLGRLEADTGYFTTVFVADSLPVLRTTAVIELQPGDVQLAVTRIVGRADTPCRFFAAMRARNDGFTILAAGDRFNGNGLEFHQVNLVNGSTFVSVYCTLLRDNVGIQITGESKGGNLLGTLQVHHVLNSVNR